MPRFQNVDTVPDHRSFTSMLRWQLDMGPERPRRRRSPSRATVPVSVPGSDGAALKSNARPSLTWIGHATYLVQLGGRSVLTDPILSTRVAVVPRNAPPGLTYETLPPIDVATVSHNHYDHMDAPTLKRLGPSVHFVVPRGLGEWFKRNGLSDVTELDWWETAVVRALTITLVPSQHWSRRGLFDQDETLWGGFVIEADGKRVYHSGDTAYFSGFKQIAQRCGTIDAAMLPIGAYEPRWFMKPQHMNPADAVQAFRDLEARRFFAMHWGTFKLTDEPLEEPPEILRAEWSDQKLEAEKLFIPAIGETTLIG